MMGDLYGALKDAGASEEKALKAAQEVAGFENAIADIRGTLKLHSWILGVNTAMLITLLWRAFAP